MTTPMSPEAQGSPTRPYLIRALHDWCTDNGFTPYLAVAVDGSVQVPMEYVKNGEIVLNVGFEATSGLQMGNDFIEFKARFGGVARDIIVPVDHVVAIYARENGQGMAFPAPPTMAPASTSAVASADVTDSAETAEPSTSSDAGARKAGRSRAGAPVIALTPSDPARAGVPMAEPGPEAGDPGRPPAGPRPALKRVK